MEERGWTADLNELIRVLLLGWVHDHGRGSQLPALGDFLDGREFSEPEVEAAAEILAGEGLIAHHATLAGPMASSVQPTTHGTQVVLRRRHLAQDPKARALGCREALLDWLYAEKRRGTEMAIVQRFSRDTRSWFNGVQFTEQDVQDAGAHLGARGLLHAVGPSGMPVIRARIEASGEQVVEDVDGRLSGWPRAAGGAVTYQQNIYGHISGQVAQGATITQTQEILGAEAFEKLILDVRAAASGLPPAEQREVVKYVDLVECEIAEQVPDTELVKVSSERLRSIAARIGDEGLSAAIQALLACAWYWFFG